VTADRHETAGSADLAAAAPAAIVLRNSSPTSANVVASLLVRAIDAGFRPAFLTEVSGAASTIVAASVATRRPGVTLGSAVVPLGSRSEATLAMEAASIADLCGAPFLLGVGLSAPAIVTDWHGADYDATVDATRRRLGRLRAILDGERQGSFSLGAGSGDRVQLLLGALGPRMLELAYEAAAGAIVNLTPARAVVRPPTGASLYANVLVGAGEEAETAVRREIVSYALSPPYARHLRRLGWGEVVSEVTDLHRTGRLREAPARLPTDLVDELYVEADALDDRLDAYTSAGAHPVAMPVAGHDPVAGVELLLDTIAAARSPARIETP
jgi:alkanesulfonate monooxygenase SsuD/methylene tetrahydromethanopterin reductase-like flavin-dependent oxidoreductase (luciferase family)